MPDPNPARRVTACLPLLVALAACTPAPTPPALDDAPAPRSGTARLAGDGAATPLLRHLARTFSDRVPGPALVVEAPLGGLGARRAVADGVLAAAITLGPVDRSAGVPIARTQPVLVTGPGVRARALSPAQLAETLQGRRPTWVDGLPRRVILRPPDDPLQQAIGRAHPLLGQALQEAHASGRWRVMPDEAELLSALRQTPGGIAVADAGGLALTALPLWVIRIGQMPPLDIRIELGPNPSPRLQAFVGFLTGPVGRSLIADLGYELPPP